MSKAVTKTKSAAKKTSPKKPKGLHIRKDVTVLNPDTWEPVGYVWVAPKAKVKGQEVEGDSTSYRSVVMAYADTLVLYVFTGWNYNTQVAMMEIGAESVQTFGKRKLQRGKSTQDMRQPSALLRWLSDRPEAEGRPEPEGASQEPLGRTRREKKAKTA